MNLFIIPGNPPAVHFYNKWIEEIAETHPDYGAFVSAYDTNLSPSSPRYLEAVAANHTKNLEKYYLEVKKPITVVGHSLGAWMALKTLTAHSKIIERCYLLYPFLQKPTARGRLILGLTHKFTKWRKFESAIIKSKPILSRIFTALDKVSTEEMRSTLRLAHHEHSTIANRRSPEDLAVKNLSPELAKKLRFIYCENDTWCPPELQKNLRKSLKNKKVYAKHDFIISSHERAQVFRTMLELAD